MSPLCSHSEALSSQAAMCLQEVTFIRYRIMTLIQRFKLTPQLPFWHTLATSLLFDNMLTNSMGCALANLFKYKMPAHELALPERLFPALRAPLSCSCQCNCHLLTGISALSTQTRAECTVVTSASEPPVPSHASHFLPTSDHADLQLGLHICNPKR